MNRVDTERARAMQMLDALIPQALSLWGNSFHIDLAQEECAEYIVRANHYKRHRVGFEKVVEEAADVYITIKAIELMGTATFWRIVNEKLNRLQERINLNDTNHREKKHEHA